MIFLKAQYFLQKLKLNYRHLSGFAKFFDDFHPLKMYAGFSYSIGNTFQAHADQKEATYLVWVGHKKDTLAYTVMGAIRAFNGFFCSLLDPLLFGADFLIRLSLAMLTALIAIPLFIVYEGFYLAQMMLNTVGVVVGAVFDVVEYGLAITHRATIIALKSLAGSQFVCEQEQNPKSRWGLITSLAVNGCQDMRVTDDRGRSGMGYMNIAPSKKAAGSSSSDRLKRMQPIKNSRRISATSSAHS